MSAGEFTSGQGADDGQFSSQGKAGTDLCQGPGFSLAVKSQNLKACPLGRQTGSSPYGAYHQIGQGHGGIEGAIALYLEAGDADADSAIQAISWPQARYKAARPLA